MTDGPLLAINGSYGLYFTYRERGLKSWERVRKELDQQLEAIAPSEASSGGGTEPDTLGATTAAGAATASPGLPPRVEGATGETANG